MSFIANKYLKANFQSFQNIIRIISSKLYDNQLFQKVEAVIGDVSLSKLFERDYAGYNRTVYRTAQNTISITEITHALLKIQPSGTTATYIRLVVDRLIEKQILVNDAFGLPNVFTINNNLIKYLENERFLFAYVLGFSEIVKEVQRSIVIVEHTPNDPSKNIGNGTGFFQRYVHNGQVISFVITNEHVVRESTIRILTQDDIEIPHSGIIIDNRGVDLAVIVVDNIADDLGIKHIYFAVDYKEIVDDIIILGYPPISKSIKPHLLVHKGEINAFVETRDTHKEMIVFSARTFPGNSGGPILNNMGRVVGVVTESAEVRVIDGDKELKLSDYYMGIPAEQIVEFMNNQVLPSLIKWISFATCSSFTKAFLR